MAKETGKPNFTFKNNLHFLAAVKDPKRNEAFGKKKADEIILECLQKLSDKTKTATVKETRQGGYGNQIKIFRTDHGGLVAIPCHERDDCIIEIVTLLNAHKTEDPSDQFWFVGNYNKFAKENNLPLAPYRFNS